MKKCGILGVNLVVPLKVNYYLVDPSWRSDIPLTTEGLHGEDFSSLTIWLQKASLLLLVT